MLQELFMSASIDQGRLELAEKMVGCNTPVYHVFQVLFEDALKIFEEGGLFDGDAETRKGLQERVSQKFLPESNQHYYTLFCTQVLQQFTDEQLAERNVQAEIQKTYRKERSAMVELAVKEAYSRKRQLHYHIFCELEKLGV